MLLLLEFVPTLTACANAIALRDAVLSVIYGSLPVTPFWHSP